MQTTGQALQRDDAQLVPAFRWSFGTHCIHCFQSLPDRREGNAAMKAHKVELYTLSIVGNGSQRTQHHYISYIRYNIVSLYIRGWNAVVVHVWSNFWRNTVAILQKQNEPVQFFPFIENHLFKPTTEEFKKQKKPPKNCLFFHTVIALSVVRTVKCWHFKAQTCPNQGRKLKSSVCFPWRSCLRREPTW